VEKSGKQPSPPSDTVPTVPARARNPVPRGFCTNGSGDGSRPGGAPTVPAAPLHLPSGPEHLFPIDKAAAFCYIESRTT